MNLTQLVKAISKSSAKSEKRLKEVNPFRFSHLPYKQQEKIVEDSIKGLKRNPTTNDIIVDKILYNAINDRMHNVKYMNNLKNSEALANLPTSLDKQADEFLAKNANKISKDLEDYTTIPLDYGDKYNRVNLSKFVDEEGNELAQSEALDQLFGSEGINTLTRDSTDSFKQDFLNANSNMDYNKFLVEYYPELSLKQRLGFIDYIDRFNKAKNDPLTININDDIVSASDSSMMDALNYKLSRENAKDFVKSMNIKFNRREHDWLQKVIDDYKEDVLLRDPTVLPKYNKTNYDYIDFNKNINSYPQNIKNSARRFIHKLQNNTYEKPIKKESLERMYEKYRDINTQQPDNAWKNLKNDTPNGSVKVIDYKLPKVYQSKYDKNVKYKALNYGPQYLIKNLEKQPYDKNKLAINEIFYKQAKDDAQRLYNELDLPGFTEELDSITGQPISEITKHYELDPYFEEAPLIPERTYKKGTKLYELQQKRLNR